MPLPRLRLARETRLLLVTVVLSAATLLLLARFRFPDAPERALPREQPLQRLAAEALFDELAATVSRARSRLTPFVPVLQLEAPAQAAPASVIPGPRRSWVPALRFRDDLAVAAVTEAAGLHALSEQGASNAVLLAEDRARGFAVVRIEHLAPLSGPLPFDLAPPRSTPTGYAVAIDGAPGGPAARPIFVDRFDPLPGTLWPTARALPASLRPGQAGTIVADLDGRVLGMVLGAREPALVPASALVQAAERLLTTHASTPSTIGVELHDLDGALAAATRAARGAIVAFVEPAGSAAEVLRVGDVIEEVQGEAAASAAEITERVRAADPGTTLLLGVRREGDLQELPVTAVARAPEGEGEEAAARATPPAQLGLDLVLERGAGARVRRVAPGSAGDRAGLAPGDVIAWMAGEARPAPEAVRRAFAAAAPGASLLVSVARGGSHRVLVVEKR